MASNLIMAVVVSMLSFLKPYYPTNTEVTVKQTMCLAETIYFESRGESLECQIANAYLVLNRVSNANGHNFNNKTVMNVPITTVSNHPDKSICEIVHSNSQFSYYDKNNKRKISEYNAWVTAIQVAIYTQYGVVSNPIADAVMYNTVRVKAWESEYTVLSKIDHHYYYTKNKSLRSSVPIIHAYNNPKHSVHKRVNYAYADYVSTILYDRHNIHKYLDG